MLNILARNFIEILEDSVVKCRLPSPLILCVYLFNDGSIVIEGKIERHITKIFNMIFQII